MRIREYAPGAFASPSDECDLLMKGGITSGLVYPYAALELARKYRFRCIGGTSVGAIAAALVAAAEYARTVRNDPDGFLRLQARCEEVPERLASLFQPAAPYAALLGLLLDMQGRKGRFAKLFSVLRHFWGTALAGALAGAGLMAALAFLPTLFGYASGHSWPGTILGGVVGAASLLGVRLYQLVKGLPNHGFGMCPGLRQPGFGNKPALTDWLHDAIQDVAFGTQAASTPPLTFGDLEQANPKIELRMITTNLSMCRPHSLRASGSPQDFRATSGRISSPKRSWPISTGSRRRCPAIETFPPFLSRRSCPSLSPRA